MNFQTFEQHALAVVEFVRANQGWAPLIVGLLAFGESLAFISLLIPATVALVGIGALVGASGISFFPIWLAAGIGAALGDWVSYWVGLKFEEPVAKVWPLSRYPDLVPSGHAFVEKYGIYAVFIGRFFGPFRAVVPLVAGILEMPFWPFQVANFTSAFLWATVLLAPGWLGLKMLF
ncbi:MAG TPA: DedA family protein [Xanthobacteraceae bacterium]|nr:DedA family protein [Xanthobacteraceae bacterium]